MLHRQLQVNFPGIRLHMGDVHRLGILVHKRIHKVAHQILPQAGAVNDNARHCHLVHLILGPGDMDGRRAEHRLLLVQNQAFLLLSLKHQLHRHILLFKPHRLHRDGGRHPLVQADVGDA